MNKADFEAKLNQLPTEKADDFDEKSIKRIQKTSNQKTVTQKQLEADIEYSGKISLRLPKSLHKDLASYAKQEGVSLNQYLLYKLSH